MVVQTCNGLLFKQEASRGLLGGFESMHVR